MLETGETRDSDPTDPAAWQPEEIAFAVAELHREFPTRRRQRVASAVNSAACSLVPKAGRVKLLQEARRRVA